jgi:hypothetical protein
MLDILVSIVNRNMFMGNYVNLKRRSSKRGSNRKEITIWIGIYLYLSCTFGNSTKGLRTHWHQMCKDLSVEKLPIGEERFSSIKAHLIPSHMEFTRVINIMRMYFLSNLDLKSVTLFFLLIYSIYTLI